MTTVQVSGFDTYTVAPHLTRKGVETATWTRWCPEKHDDQSCVVSLPSLFECGKHSISFCKVHAQDENMMRIFDQCNMLSLTNVHAMFRKMGGLSNDQAMALDMFYAVSVNLGVDYYRKSSHEELGDETLGNFAPCISLHAKLMEQSRLDATKLTTFYKSLQKVAQAILESSFKVDNALLEASLRSLAISGLGALVLQAPGPFYVGCDAATPSSHQLTMLNAYRNTIEALDCAESCTKLSKYLLCAYLYGEHGVSRSIGIHALPFDPTATCRVCHEEVLAGDLSTGLARLCKQTLLCRTCVKSKAAPVDIKVDYETAAVECAAKAMALVRKGKEQSQAIEKLEAELAHERTHKERTDELPAALRANKDMNKDMLLALTRKDELIASLLTKLDEDAQAKSLYVTVAAFEKAVFEHDQAQPVC